jgi:hypothetical protein
MYHHSTQQHVSDHTNRPHVSRLGVGNLRVQYFRSHAVQSTHNLIHLATWLVTSNIFGLTCVIENRVNKNQTTICLAYHISLVYLDTYTLTLC